VKADSTTQSCFS